MGKNSVVPYSSTPSPLPAAPRRILIIKPSSLGDVVHALPTVNAIRSKYPKAHLAWLINHELVSLLKNCPLIDERIEFHRRAHGAWLPLLRQLRSGRFDLVLDLQGLLRSGLFARVTGARRRIGLSDSREGARFFHNEIIAVPWCHAVDRYLLAARQLDCDSARIAFPLGESDADRSAIDRILGAAGFATVPSRELIAINPMARWETKIWGDDKFAALLDQLAGRSIVLIGSASERDRIEAINQGRALNLAGRLDLAQLTALYRRCKLVISNDTGPMHIAAAVGTPVVAIFGPTDPVLVGPYGPGHTIVRATEFTCPCRGPRCMHSPPHHCMAAISVDQVAAAVSLSR